MLIELIPFADAIERETILNKTVVVIDVLRATSVITTALSNGASSVWPVASTEEAILHRRRNSNPNLLLAGERDAIKIEGFDLGNSPLEYHPEAILHKDIVLTTTNGTRALKSSTAAKKVLIGSFLNLDAVCHMVKDEKELVLICSGTAGKFSLDDGICAALMIEMLSDLTEVHTDDLGMAVLNIWHKHTGSLEELLQSCKHVNYLKDHGFEKDVEYCLQLNQFDLVPEFLEGRIQAEAEEFAL